MTARRSATPSSPPSNAREAVIKTLLADVNAYPRLAPRDVSFGLPDERDERLASAIHLTVMRRWLTLRFIIDQFMDRRPYGSLDDAVQASLLAGVAQLMFLRRLPVHAVIDETVEAARPVVEQNTVGLINAVLRRIGEHRGDVVAEPWRAERQMIPCEEGHIALGRIMLPPLNDMARYLEASCGVPWKLCARWIDTFGQDAAISVAHHATKQPPTIISMAAGSDEALMLRDGAVTPHDRAGCFVWQGEGDALRSTLAANAQAIVQDPTAAEPVRYLASILKERPATIVDYCAGRGTKTRQLRASLPKAHIIATDADPARMRDLHQQFDKAANVDAISIDALDAVRHRASAEVIILDVPCTNTGVLARRPEARYRFARNMLDRLIQLQRAIIRRALPLLKEDGRLIYSTCSIDAAENEKQIEWVTRELGMAVTHEQLTLPDGVGRSYHDGGYFAVLSRPK